MLENFDIVRRKLEAWCAYQERCISEVQTKIQSFNLSTIEGQKLIHFLLKHNYLNENRFAQSYISGKVNIKKWGRNKIFYELQRKDISKEIIQKSWKEIDQDVYLSNLKLLINKKFNELGKTDFKTKQKVIKYLLAKGYESNLILDFLD